MAWAALFITSVLIRTYCSAQVTVTQQAFESVTPGNTVLLSCTVSGFSIDTYAVRWYQQKEGERPRFLLWYRSDSSKGQGDGVPDRFSGSKDAPKNTAYLTIKSTLSEDEAKYYCACWHSDAWLFGGGTQLTVHSGEVMKPSVFIYAPSEEELKTNSATLVCTASNYRPRSATMEFMVDGQKWTNGIVISPVTKQSDNSYMGSSFLTMTSSDYNKYKEYSCKVTHEGKEFVQILKRSECF